MSVYRKMVWFDIEVSIPDDYTEVRLRSLPMGTVHQPWNHDIALWHVILNAGTEVSDLEEGDLFIIDNSTKHLHRVRLNDPDDISGSYGDQGVSHRRQGRL